MVDQVQRKKFPTRSVAAACFFACAWIGFASGVSVTERPGVAAAGLLTQAYYSLSLFVVGGVDLGTPQGGPWWARVMVWVAYFGAPVLTASTLIEALWRAISPQSWYLRRLKNHIIIVGSGELSLSYLRVLRAHNPRIRVLIVCSGRQEQAVLDEFRQAYDASVVVGDITHEFFLRQLRVERAKKILLLSDDSLRSYEAASVLLQLVPDIGPRVIIHCASLRFMRAMSNTRVAKNCETFNTYHLAAAGLVRSQVLQHFQGTSAKDVVVIAGFGRFGQTILEELQRMGASEIAAVIIIEMDAHRRVLVAEEQMAFSGNFRREVYEGDISNPDTWTRVRDEVDVDANNAVFVLGTGREEDNLRTALWIRRQFPEAMVIARSSKESRFAEEVGQDHGLVTVSINQLVEENIPPQWIDV